MTYETRDLLAARKDGEPIVVLMIHNLRPVSKKITLFGTRTSSYRFRFDREYRRHIIKVPLSIWEKENYRFGTELIENKRNPMIITTVELPVQQSPSEPVTATASGPLPPFVDPEKVTQGAMAPGA
jgi:hypothetical protein